MNNIGLGLITIGKEAAVRAKGGGKAAGVNKVCPAITPSLGGDLWDAPAAAFTSGTYHWTGYGTNVKENDSNSLKITYGDNAGGAYEYLRDSYDLSSDLTVGAWYQLALDAKVSAGNSVDLTLDDNPWVTVVETDFTNKLITFNSTSTNQNIIKCANMGTGEVLWIDNTSLKPLTFPSMLAFIGSTTGKNGTYQCTPSLVARTQCGMIIEYHDTNNFVAAYHDGTNVNLVSRIAGTYAAVLSVAAAYVPGAILKVFVNETDHWCYYNDALVSIPKSIDNSGMGENIYGFSTYANNTPGTISWAPSAGDSLIAIYPLNAATACVTPAYDASGQAMHPRVVYVPGGWPTSSDPAFWMVETPYTNNDITKENPCILQSTDKVNWSVPTGLTNPIDPYPGSGIYNSDSELFLGQDGLMHLYWRRSTTPNTTMYESHSSDGVNWSAKVSINYNGTDFMSPTIFGDGIQYVMYDVQANSTLRRRTCAAADGAWSAPTNCAVVNGNPTGKIIWHISADKVGSDYRLLIAYCDASTSGGNTILYYAVSTDGLNFTRSTYPILCPSSAWDNDKIYRSAGIWNGNNCDLWYSGRGGAGWHVGHTTFSIK